ncbi:MAG: hypothetical protein WA174_10930 [Rhodoferax sp.]
MTNRRYIAALWLLAAITTVTSAAAQETAEPAKGSEPGVVTKVEKATVHAAQVAASGVKRGAHAAAKGIKRGAEAVAHGVERGATATGNAAKTVVKKIKGSDEPAPEEGK